MNNRNLKKLTVDSTDTETVEEIKQLSAKQHFAQRTHKWQM